MFVGLPTNISHLSQGRRGIDQRRVHLAGYNLPMGRKATARDVAELAGASRSAVSMVFNGRADGNVAKGTQERIREAAAQLHYSPTRSHEAFGDAARTSSD